MFDIGFWELAVIGVVALIVVGPEDFPSLVRNATRGLNKVRRFIGSVKSDLEHEISKADEIKKLVAEESKIAEVHEMLGKATDRITIPAGSKGQSQTKDNDERLENRPDEAPPEPQSAGASSEPKQS